MFDDMEEPTVEIAVWTTTREEALRKVAEKAPKDEGELSPQVVDENRQKYKDMLSSLAMRDATEEEYRKTRGVWAALPRDDEAAMAEREVGKSGGRGAHCVLAG